MVFLSPPPVLDPRSSPGKSADRSQWHHPLPIKEVNEARDDHHGSSSSRSTNKFAGTNDSISSHSSVSNRAEIFIAANRIRKLVTQRSKASSHSDFLHCFKAGCLILYYYYYYDAESCWNEQPFLCYGQLLLVSFHLVLSVIAISIRDFWLVRFN